MHRRRFLKTGAAAATSFMVLPNWVVGSSPSPNSRVNIAVVGVGGRGINHVDAYEGENIVALCDVDEKRAAASFAKHPDVPRFRDFRVMFDKMGDRIDAVSIATPDHMHYPIALWALTLGKHVYCEKPLVRTVWEARHLKAVAAEAGVVTQMGNQGHTYEGLRYIQEWTQAGLTGRVKEVMHWSNRPIWPQGELQRGDAPVPATLDYDLWLGIAPKKPFDPEILPFHWRGWKDYGCGAIGDMACHIMDASYTGLGLDRPVAVEASASGHHVETFPQSETIRYTFARPEDGSPLTVTWSDGGRLPDLGQVPGVPEDFFAERVDGQGRVRRSNANGTFIVGENGTLWTDTYSATVKVFPETYFQQLRGDGALPPKTLPRVKGGPFREFVDAIRNGETAGSDFQYAADFTETALLGIVALEAGERIEYDGAKGRVTNLKEADKYLKSRYEYRPGFSPA